MGAACAKNGATYSLPRNEYVHKLENIGISQPVYRIEKLQAGAEDLSERRNYIAMAAMLEQAAKDMGDFFTNRREVTGKKEGTGSSSSTRLPP